MMKKWLVLFLGIFCIGISAIFVKKAEVNGLISALYRILVALILISPFIAFRKRKKVANHCKTVSFLAGVFFGLELACWNIAIMKSSATIPSVLVNLSSVWVCIGAFLFLKEKVGLFHWIGNSIAIFGVLVIIGFRSLIHLNFEAGILLSISASFFLAIYTLLIRRVRGETDTLSVLFYALIGSALPLLLLCLAMRLPVFGFSGKSFIYLIALGVVTQLGGYLSISYALGYIDSAKVSVTILLQPLLTALFARILLGEFLSTHKIVGGIIVVAGIGATFIDRGRNHSSPSLAQKSIRPMSEECL